MALLRRGGQGPNEKTEFLNQTVNSLGLTFAEWVADLVDNGDTEGIEAVLALIAPSLDEDRERIIIEVLEESGRLDASGLPPLGNFSKLVFDLTQDAIDEIVYDEDFADYLPEDSSLRGPDEAPSGSGGNASGANPGDDPKEVNLLAWVIPLATGLILVILAAAIFIGVTAHRRRAEDARAVWWQPPGAGRAGKSSLLTEDSGGSFSGEPASYIGGQDGQTGGKIPLTVNQAAMGGLKRGKSGGSSKNSVHPLPSDLGDASLALRYPSAASSIASTSYIDLSELELFETVGKGAFGVVFKGVWRGQDVAVKVLSLAFSEEAAHVKSFKKEVDVLQRLDHPHIVKLMGASLAPPDVCIVEELMPNGSLHDALHRRRWKPAYQEILTIVHDVSSALAYLHPRIVHCDLKPQNVLLTLEDRAKVADFGIAKIKRGTYIHGTTANVNGTPGYMAPELFSSGKVTEKCDVFSIGVLIWVCYTGKEPWGDFAFPMQVVMAVAVERRRPEVPQDMPPPLVSLLRRCWQEEPHRRPSCAELQKQTLLLIEEERAHSKYGPAAPVLSSHPL